MNWLMRVMKYWLTRVGARLSRGGLVQIQAAVNYLRIGKWSRDHGFEVARRVRTREEVWEAVLNQVRHRKVLYLEFGVAYGESMEYWSRALKHPESILHGFDSFEGLPEEAGPWRKGQFDAGGRFPQIADRRVAFFKGWFDQVLPGYAMPACDVLVINMDADIYSSTLCVLRHLGPHIKPGVFLYFDEMNHVDHEPRAFDDFMRESGLEFRIVSADATLAFMFFECVGPVPRSATRPAHA